MDAAEAKRLRAPFPRQETGQVMSERDPLREALKAHPEATCDKCGRANHTWSAPNDLWNATVGTPDNPRGEGLVLCPTCFTTLVSARIEELEAALRKIKNAPMYPYRADDIARAALDKDKE